MKQEVRDFLSKAEVKLVDPYLVRDTVGNEYLCIAEDISTEDIYVETMLCINKNNTSGWLAKQTVTPIQPKTRPIEDRLVEGDIIINIGTQEECKVLMANQYCVILSRDNDFDKTLGSVYTYSELIEIGYTLKQ